MRGVFLDFLYSNVNVGFSVSVITMLVPVMMTEVAMIVQRVSCDNQ